MKKIAGAGLVLVLVMTLGACTSTGTSASDTADDVLVVEGYGARSAGNIAEGEAVEVLLRPEALRLNAETSAATLAGRVTEIINEGNLATVVLDIGGSISVQVSVPDPHMLSLPEPGSEAAVCVPSGVARAFPADK